jgi:hypothetical protein
MTLVIAFHPILGIHNARPIFFQLLPIPYDTIQITSKTPEKPKNAKKTGLLFSPPCFLLHFVGACMSSKKREELEASEQRPRIWVTHLAPAA